MIVPPDNFAFVEDGIYRCSKLDPINYTFLKTLDLKSILWMDEEKPPRLMSKFIEDNNIRMHHLMNSSVLPEEDEMINVKYQDWMVLKPVLISKIFQILLNSKNHNCLLIDKSEVVVGILRHIQRWSYSSISNEYRLYSTNKANYLVENFLELINIELVPHNDDMEIEIDNHGNEFETEIDDVEANKLHVDNNDSDTDIYGNDTLDSDYSENGLSSKNKNINVKTEETEDDINYSNFNHNYNSSQAISIRRPSLVSSSPAMRRLSINNGISPGQSSLGSHRLSISTSPQIPKNLLRMVEMRKQKRMQKEQGNDDLTEKPKVSPSNRDIPKDTTRDEEHNSHKQHGELKKLLEGHEPKELTTNALQTYQSDYNTGNITHTKRKPKASLYHFYLPKSEYFIISDKQKPVNTSIRVKLPRERDLPLWFVQLRDSWESDCINDLTSVHLYN